MKKLYASIGLLIVLSLVLTACGGGGGGGAFKVGQVTDLGGIDDKSFNATAYAGLTQAVEELGVEAWGVESNAYAAPTGGGGT